MCVCVCMCKEGDGGLLVLFLLSRMYHLSIEHLTSLVCQQLIATQRLARKHHQLLANK